MFKILALTMALFVASQASSIKMAGGLTDGVVTDTVMDIARWTASQLSAYTNVDGEHTIMTVRNLKTQVVAGINYRFTLDVLAQSAEDNKYYFKSCDIAVFDQPWTNTRQFIEEPKCGDHPNFQN